jgi:carbonic anhydrase
MMLDDHDHDHDRVHEYVDERADDRDDWARRRRKGIPTDENLLVVACMDERIPVAEALGL